MKHAQARTCVVRFVVDTALQLEIMDDGLGLPPERKASVGLISMRERAEELGGTYAIESVPGGGTRVLAHIPVGTLPHRGDV